MKYASVTNGIIFLFILLVLVQQHTSATMLISPSNPKINYYGRVDFSNPATPQYSWSGVIIEANFTGSEIGMQIDHPGSFYAIEIDGKTDTTVSVTTAGAYIFTTDLSPSTHTVRIKLKSEDHYTGAKFLGLLLADGHGLTDPPPKPLRKIEFIGDSYTAGYGIESSGRVCTSDEIKKYTNVFQTFAQNVTEAFHAQNIVLGWSGAGIVRNYGSSTKRSDDPFPAYYDFTLGAVWNSPQWNSAQWQPDLVVICLGTNDYSTTPNPDDSMYIGDYHKFIARILEKYPDASILCVSTGNATFEQNVKTVIAEEKSTYNHARVFFAPYPSGLNNDACDWHPSIDDNKRIAQVLIDTIMIKTGWDTTSASVVITSKIRRDFSHPAGLHVTQSHDLVSIHSSLVSPEKIVFFSLDGKRVLHLDTDEKGKCSILKSSLPGKSFLIGSVRCGWQKITVMQ